MKDTALVPLRLLLATLLMVLVSLAEAASSNIQVNSPKPVDLALPWADSVTLKPYERSSFNPSGSETFTFTLAWADSKAKAAMKAITLQLYTQDQELVRELPVNLTHAIEAEDSVIQVHWDGLDDQGTPVPNEAYFPALLIQDLHGDIQQVPLAEHSGGEEVYDFHKNIVPGRIEYQLPVASRVLIRTGIQQGPMLRTLLDWQVRRAGFHAERWNGYDSDHVIAIDQQPDVGYLIVGYQLPDYAVLTHGNAQENYRSYRERRGWPLPKTSHQDRLLERKGTLIRSEFYTPLLQQKSPRIDVQLLDADQHQLTDQVTGFDELLVKVDLNAQDELYLDQTRYEISFFVDYQFIAEEEQGYVPFSWRFSPGRYGIEPGEHVLTINVSGYEGQVGVRNVPFTLINSVEP